MVLHFGYLAKIVNIETASLYGDLKEEIYMECLQGMADVKKEDFVILNNFSMALFKQLRNIIERLWRF